VDHADGVEKGQLVTKGLVNCCTEQCQTLHS
jgi:hypothetical protein